MPSIFISYRHEDCAAVAGRLYDRLSQRFGATNVFRDIDAIVAGDPFVSVIAERIRTCDALIALIGKNWLDAKDAEGRRRLDQPCDFVAFEISEALAHRKLVIPALVEDASMPTREALPRSMSLLADRHAIPISDSRFDYDTERLIGAITKVASGLTRRELRNRRDLLDDIKGEVANRLAQSLHNAVLINLLKETQPQKVRPPWLVDVKVPHQPSTLLPPETEIIDVFDQDAIAGRLLVLGAPGAGKTTTLLQLARELIARAETDAAVPMPVLLNLSSWKDDNQTLARWLETELKLKYGVRQDICKRWLDERCLLPLLDGLDELEPTRQEQCVQAINTFQQDYRPDQLVVCCRSAEYENCNTKLGLNGAISLQPLTAEHICNYLLSAKDPALWTSIQADTELLELARSPLLLRMLTLASEARPIQEWQTLSLTQERHQYLFDVYIERMLSREIKGKQYTRENTLHWLAWLAKQLRNQSQTDFLIEKLQPTWLHSLTQKWIYRIAVVLLVALVCGMSGWLIDLTLQLVPKGKLTLALGENIAGDWGVMGIDVSQFVNSYGPVITTLIPALFVGLRQTIRPIETLQWSGTRAWRGMVLGLRRWSIAGSKYAAYVGLMAGQIGWPIVYLNFHISASDALAVWKRVGQIAGVISGLIAGVAVLLITRWLQDIQDTVADTQSVWLNRGLRDWGDIRWADALISALMWGIGSCLSSGGPPVQIGVLGGLGVGIIAGLSHGLSNRPAFRMADALMVGLIGWLISGLVTWITGTTLFKVLPMGLSYWMLHLLCGWLGVAATAGLIACLIARLRRRSQAVETLPGGGMEVRNWLALRWRQWLIGGVVAASVTGVSLVLLMGWGQIPVIQAIYTVWFSLGLGVIFALNGSFMVALTGALLGAMVGGLFGALLGSLSEGLTGPEIERRTVPNQGVRQSAGNVGVFVLIGGITLGTISGLVTLSLAVLMTRRIPEASDLLRHELSWVLYFGLLSGLVPGAACIQHFALRFILWCRGVTPWNYVRFLNYATERMLLQRVGGRYRFIHELLREHFATVEPRRVES